MVMEKKQTLLARADEDAATKIGDADFSRYFPLLQAFHLKLANDDLRSEPMGDASSLKTVRTHEKPCDEVDLTDTMSMILLRRAYSSPFRDLSHRLQIRIVHTDSPSYASATCEELGL